MRSSMLFRNALIFMSMVSLVSTATLAQAVKVAPHTSVHPDSIVIFGGITMNVPTALVNFKLNRGGVTYGDQPITIMTSWGAGLALGSYSVSAYFNNPTAALTGTKNISSTIPASAVSGQMSAASGPGLFGPITIPSSLPSWTPLTTKTTLFTQQIFTIFWVGSSTRTDALSLQIDLTRLPQLPADTYKGILTIQLDTN